MKPHFLESFGPCLPRPAIFACRIGSISATGVAATVLYKSRRTQPAILSETCKHLDGGASCGKLVWQMLGLTEKLKVGAIVRLCCCLGKSRECDRFSRETAKSQSLKFVKGWSCSLE